MCQMWDTLGLSWHANVVEVAKCTLSDFNHIWIMFKYIFKQFSIIACVSFFLPLIFLRAHQIITFGWLSKAFSRFTNTITRVILASHDLKKMAEQAWLSLEVRLMLKMNYRYVKFENICNTWKYLQKCYKFRKQQPNNSSSNVNF